MANAKAGESTPHFRRALFVRLDRIGDLVLTLPTDRSLSIERIDWWIPKGLAFVTNDALPPRQSREFSKTQTLRDIVELARSVQKKRYDFVVVFQAPWWVGFVVWLARVPLRIGVKSQWHSFLFFNRGIRQKRSRAEASELEYGFRLLEAGLQLPKASLERSTLKLRSMSGALALEKTRLTPRNYYVVHPGMGGSALNWPTEKYAELIRTLSLETRVVITGTASDESFLAPLKVELAKNENSDTSNFDWLDGKLSGDELIAILENARAVVAPSTGVLHLAASTGVATVGLFSQVHVQRAVRWGPQGEKTAVVEAPPGAPVETSMSLITVDQVLAAIRSLIGN